MESLKEKLMMVKLQSNAPADKFVNKSELMFSWVNNIKSRYFTVKIAVFTYVKCNKATSMYSSIRTHKSKKIKERKKHQSK